VPRFARLNVIASVQPIHQPSDMFVADRTLGKRARWTYPFRSLLDSGAHLYFGSDCPVETLDPLRGIHAAVTRQNENGEPADGWYPEERISVPAAVSAYTRTAHPSDWVVLSRNIFEIPPREILETRVEYTIVGGNIVYAANQDA
ncbi:MAG TPA: amidohydrolase family protein, partial [Anaerolineae bacterium]